MGRHVARIGRLGLQRCIFMPLSQWSDVRLLFSRRSEAVLTISHSGERSRREQILAVHIETYTFSSADSVMEPIRSNSQCTMSSMRTAPWRLLRQDSYESRIGSCCGNERLPHDSSNPTVHSWGTDDDLRSNEPS